VLYKHSYLYNFFILLAAASLLLGLLTGTVLSEDDTTDSPLVRLEGANRFETAAVIADHTYDQADTVVIARGDDYADGLAGNLLAGALDAPVLLTSTDNLPNETADAVTALGASEAYILGGETAISSKVEDQLEEIIGTGSTSRLAGQTREETAALIAGAADEAASLAGYAYIVNGTAYADAMAVGPLAASNNVPILQVREDEIPHDTKTALEEMGLENLVIIGGEEVISQEVQEKLAEQASVNRVSGEDRYSTSVAVAMQREETPENFIFAGGTEERLADALAGGYLGAAYDAPLLYVSDQVPEAVAKYLSSAASPENKGFLLGGTAAITETAANQVAAAILEVEEPKEGELVKETLEHGEFERYFEYYLPSGYEEEDSLPVVFSFHGLGSSAEDQRQLTGFTEVAEKEDFIAVFPESTELEGEHPSLPELPGAEKQWNTGMPTSLQHEAGVDDVGFTGEIVDRLTDNYAADESRIYTTGMSNGGMFSYVLAVELSDRIAGAASVTAPMTVNLVEQEPQRPVSMVIMMGDEDPIVSYEGDGVSILSIEDTVNYWKHVNGITDEPEESYLEETADDDPTRVKKTHYTGGENDTEIALYTIEGGGHTWPGGHQYLPEEQIGRTTGHMDGSEVIWEHLKEHSLPEEIKDPEE